MYYYRIEYMMNYIHLLFDTFLTNVSHRFNIPKSVVQHEWEKSCASQIDHTPIIILLDHDQEIVNDKKEKKELIKKDHRCSYIYTKSGRFFKKGEQCKKDCKPFHNTCEKHQHYENQVKDNEENNENDVKKIKTNEAIDHGNVENNIKRKNIILKLNHVINRYVHTSTGLVFYSNDERVVFAKLDENENTLIRLTDNDIELCKYYGFKVNSSKF